MADEEVNMAETTAPVRLLLWDLGNVLVSLQRERFPRLLAEAMEVPIDDFHSEVFASGLFEALNEGKISATDFYRDVQDRTGRELPYPAFVKGWCDFLLARPKMEELLQRLHGKIPMWLLSNTDPLHHSWCLEHFTYLKMVTPQLTSYELGAMKPAPALYQRVLEELPVAAEAVLFFDDLVENVEGAKQAGMQAHLFTTPEACEEILQYSLPFSF